MMRTKALCAWVATAILAASAPAPGDDLAQEKTALAARLASTPDDVDALGRMADVLLDLGDYDPAAAIIARLATIDTSPTSLARAARLAVSRGDVPNAERLLREALASQKKAGDSALAVSPYHAKIGRVLFDAGRLDDAETEYKAAVKIMDVEHAKLHQLDIPHDETSYANVEAAAGLARILTARGDAKKAERAWKQTASRAPGPELLAEAGDSYAALGKTKEAAAMYARAEKSAAANPRFRRDLARFQIDHDRNLPEALKVAQDEARVRKDVATMDLLAWALFKNGQTKDAAAAIAQAMRTGSRDARVWFHSGMIHDALGDAPRARADLAKALEINPHFSPLDAKTASAKLAGTPQATSSGSAGR